MPPWKIIRGTQSLYFRWVVTNTLSWMLGMIGVFAVIILILAPLNPPWTYDYYGRYIWSPELSILMVGLLHLIIAAIAGGAGGYVYGNFQYAFLKCHFEGIPGWKKTSILNWSLGCAIVAAVSWLLASLSPRPDMYGGFYPPDPIGYFSLFEWLSDMVVGAALGTNLACFTQGSLLHDTILSRNENPRSIRNDWRIAFILGTIIGFFFEGIFDYLVQSIFPIEVWRSMPWLYLLSPILIPGAVVGLTSGLVLVRVLIEVSSIDASSQSKHLSRLVGLSAFTLSGIAIIGYLHLGLKTCGWLDRLLGVSGCQYIMEGDAVPKEISFSLDGRMLTSLPIWDKIKIWEIPTGQLIHQYEIPDVETLILSNHGELLATGGFNSPIRLWQLPAGDLLHTFYNPDWDTYSLVDLLAFSQTDQLLAAVSNDIVQMWRIFDGTLLGEFESVMPNRIAFLPDAQSLLIGTGSGTIWRWDPPYVEPQILLDGLGYVYTMDFTPDGSHVAILSRDDSLQVWRIADGIMLWAKDAGYQRCLDISPDGSMMATTSQDPFSRYQDPIYIWNMEDGYILDEFSGQCDVAFSPDGQYLASYGDDYNRIWLWKVEDVQESPDG
jgi:WD40 repeat protein